MTTIHHHAHPAGGEHRHQLSESYNHVRGGPAVLDIGGDIGAMIVTMPPSAAGTELHLRSEHQPPLEIHTGVWHRRSGAEETTTAVFAELVAGTYWVLDGSAAATRKVQVTGGELVAIELTG